MVATASQDGASGSSGATFCGVPLPLLSLVTLTVQNSLLTIVLHYSRVRVPADEMYSAASAVLLNEILKAGISLSVAYTNALRALPPAGYESVQPHQSSGGSRFAQAARNVARDVFSFDSWKLSVPAILYVVQNNLQFVAASNLDVPTFQVSYNLKILTTALCSVLMLKRRLSLRKWGALVALAVGVAMVQVQSSSGSSHGSAEDLDRTKGLLAVLCACTTSGLAGVYFEMVLKGSSADLWVRNVQLCFFSLVPAVTPVFFPSLSFSPPTSTASDQGPFAYFGFWAWMVVLCQVAGGLITALVIKYADNILKGFATSLAIVLSFAAGVILFDTQITASFLLGASIVMAATYTYNVPDSTSIRASLGGGSKTTAGAASPTIPLTTTPSPAPSQPFTPEGSPGPSSYALGLGHPGSHGMNGTLGAAGSPALRRTSYGHLSQ